MWKVLGEETMAITVGDTWKKRVLELSKRKKDAERFRNLLEKADLRYYFDAIKEVHAFMLQFPSDADMADLEFLRDFILKVHSSAKMPVVEFEGEEMRFAVVITADEERDDHKKRNDWWQ